MLKSAYPFLFIMNLKDEANQDGLLQVKLYRFKSTKSKITYIVRVEKYMYNIYAVKFYPKKYKDSKNKYRIATNTFEPRRIINTCINIMLSIYKEDTMASFGFIGANGLNENSTNCTKRYRVYSKIMATYFSSERFYHKENKEKSAYMLINKKSLHKDENLISKIESFLWNNMITLIKLHEMMYIKHEKCLLDFYFSLNFRKALFN